MQLADQQRDDGFVPIPNNLMDALAKIRIPGEARQVLDVIYRRTLGWNKGQELIRLSEFEDITGLSKVHVLRSISKLLSMNLIFVTKKGSAATYEPNRDFSSWIPLPKRANNVTKKGNENITNKGNITQKGNETLPKRVINITQKGNEKSRKANTEGNPQTPTDNTDNTYIKKSQIFLPDAPAYRLATLMLDEILKANPVSRLHSLNNGRREGTIQKWAVSIDKLIRLDHQEPSTVEEVIQYAVADDFWGSKILSGDKLRDKWDTLTREMRKRGKAPPKKRETHAPPGKRYVVYGGITEAYDENTQRTVFCRIHPAKVIEGYRVNPDECIEFNEEIFKTKDIDVSQLIPLRPPEDGVYDLQREIQRQLA